MNDSIVMYLVVNESLGMSIGKTAAQCAHASQMLTTRYFKLEEQMRHNLGLLGRTDPKTMVYQVDDFAMNKVYVMREWLAGEYGKIVLKANDEEWRQIKEAVSNYLEGVIVVDNGHTEIPEGSETVIGFFPRRKSDAPKIIKQLKLLK